ncbi:MAG: adenylate/guanylate cyclase domain-containing protein, partial [Rhodospirillaceae bacterium]|nr:adenylate/guanylate cyclase domain-containing protein [Rhodospirillaceae bacterium]
NKYFGTCVCVAGSTVESCPDSIMRPIGEIVLKGKEDDVFTFEPVPGETPTTYSVADYATAYSQMRTNDPDAIESFRVLSENWPDDPLAAFHLGRLQSGETGARIVMDEK